MTRFRSPVVRGAARAGQPPPGVSPRGALFGSHRTISVRSSSLGTSQNVSEPAQCGMLWSLEVGVGWKSYAVVLVTEAFRVMSGHTTLG